MTADDDYAEDLRDWCAEDEDGSLRQVRHAGHLGMAIKLAEQFSGRLLFVNKRGWHRWDSTRWAPDGDGTARRAVHTLLRRERAQLDKLPGEERESRGRAIARLETAQAITGILTEAAALQAFSVVVDAIDADPWLLNCANGTLDLRTMELREHNPDDLITKVARAAYTPNAGGATWTR